MKIITKGNYNKEYKIKRFTCDYCGCVFETNNYKYQTNRNNKLNNYFCECPWCHNITYKYINVIDSMDILHLKSYYENNR